jgi:hypothetical protein
MKFISKNPNLRVVLRPGIPGNVLAGKEAIAGVYVKFQGGMVEIQDNDLIEMMKKHPGFEQDYILVAENEIDPYLSTRTEVEPVHKIVEMKYGTPEKTTKGASTVALSQEVKDALVEQAKAMAKEIVRQSLPELIKEVTAEMKASEVVAETKTAEAPKAKKK